MTSNYDTNIFLNCPFDKEYVEMQSQIIFTIIYLGFEPKIASLIDDSGEFRLAKIQKMIEESKYSIHDISRLKAKKKDEFYRLNMPLELGMDIGARRFKEKFSDKKFLILEASKYDYMKAASDLNGFDIKYHDDIVEKVVERVRDWIENHSPKKSDGASKISTSYLEFRSDLYDELRNKRGFNEEQAKDLQLSELVREMKEWLLQKRTS